MTPLEFRIRLARMIMRGAKCLALFITPELGAHSQPLVIRRSYCRGHAEFDKAFSEIGNKIVGHDKDRSI